MSMGFASFIGFTIFDTMYTSALFAFLHFLFAIGLVVSISYEWVTFQKNISLTDAKRLQKADSLYGLSAIMVIIIGLLRVFYFEKGSDFYFLNTFFIFKLVVFSIVGLLSIYPTIRFMKWSRYIKNDAPPEMTNKEYATILILLRLEMIGLLIILLTASLMARGLGF